MRRRIKIYLFGLLVFAIISLGPIIMLHSTRSSSGSASQLWSKVEYNATLSAAHVLLVGNSPSLKTCFELCLAHTSCAAASQAADSQTCVLSSSYPNNGGTDGVPTIGKPLASHPPFSKYSFCYYSDTIIKSTFRSLCSEEDDERELDRRVRSLGASSLGVVVKGVENQLPPHLCKRWCTAHSDSCLSAVANRVITDPVQKRCVVYLRDDAASLQPAFMYQAGEQIDSHFSSPLTGATIVPTENDATLFTSLADCKATCYSLPFCLSAVYEPSLTKCTLKRTLAKHTKLIDCPSCTTFSVRARAEPSILAIIVAVDANRTVWLVAKLRSHKWKTVVVSDRAEVREDPRLRSVVVGTDIFAVFGGSTLLLPSDMWAFVLSDQTFPFVHSIEDVVAALQSKGSSHVLVALSALVEGATPLMRVARHEYGILIDAQGLQLLRRGSAACAAFVSQANLNSKLSFCAELLGLHTFSASNPYADAETTAAFSAIVQYSNNQGGGRITSVHFELLDKMALEANKENRGWRLPSATAQQLLEKMFAVSFTFRFNPDLCVPNAWPNREHYTFNPPRDVVADVGRAKQLIDPKLLQRLSEVSFSSSKMEEKDRTHIRTDFADLFCSEEAKRAVFARLESCGTRDVIATSLMNLPFSQLKTFIQSFQKHASQCTFLLIITGTTDETLFDTTLGNVLVESFENLLRRATVRTQMFDAIQEKRFGVLQRWCLDKGGYFRLLVAVDGRDTVLQSDIFEFWKNSGFEKTVINAQKEIYITTYEYFTVEAQVEYGHNYVNVRALAGSDYANFIGEHVRLDGFTPWLPGVCGGFVGGTPRAVVDMIDALHAVLNYRSAGSVYQTNDQGALNVLFPLGFHFANYPHRAVLVNPVKGPVTHMYPATLQRIRGLGARGDEFVRTNKKKQHLNCQGIPFAILHQIDRIPGAVEKIIGEN